MLINNEKEFLISFMFFLRHDQKKGKLSLPLFLKTDLVFNLTDF